MSDTIRGAGLGLRMPHVAEILDHGADVPWFELLADNHLAAGGPISAQTDAVASRWPLTLHCVGMNIGGTDALDFDYLARIRSLAKRVEAAWISDHLCFTSCHGHNFHDLLPLPYTSEALAHVAARVQRIQDFFGQPLVVENISAYLRFRESNRSEAEFLSELVERTGCGLLLDVNNLYVNHVNHGEDIDAYLAALPLAAVREIHLAGYSRQDGYLLDTHDHPVHPPVWSLYARVVEAVPEVPTLIEWDNDLPAFSVLLDQARQADSVRLGEIEVGPLAGLQTCLAAVLETDRSGQDVEELLPLLWEAGRINGTVGARIYRNNTKAVRIRALESTFPVCLAILGQDCFRALCRDYLDAFPSRHPDLNFYGGAFADSVAGFLAHHAGAAFTGFDYLPDLLRFEYLHHELHFAADDPPFDTNAFARLLRERADQTVLIPSAALRVFRSPWPVLGLWRAHKDGGSLPDTAGTEDRLVLWRSAHAISVERLSEDAFDLMKQLAEGVCLGDLCGHTAAWALQDFLRRGWISGCRLA